jgi:hypothetical protein
MRNRFDECKRGSRKSSLRIARFRHSPLEGFATDL